MQTANPELDALRDTITNAYRMDETTCINQLLSHATLSPEALQQITPLAQQLVTETRRYKETHHHFDALLHQYDLSTEEGIALMCLAEALLRIPDTATMDKFIGDKLATAAWYNHLHHQKSFFVNAATWSLLLTGKVYAPLLSPETDWISTLKRAASRVGISVIRPFIMQMMRAIGNQFVIGQDIHSALQHAQPFLKQGYQFSYDMLGEAARTARDAAHYYQAYTEAIDAIGITATAAHPTENPGISIKLSALTPRFDYTQRERVLKEVPPLVIALAQQAKKYQMSITIDAEEADRLDLMLDVFQMVYTDPQFKDWDGIGIALQAYQKRAWYVIQWLSALAKQHRKRIMLRLVKGAYWDTEIKISQVLGLNDYPVFTRKNATDVSYLACAKALLAEPDCFYPQFGTHNAYSVAAITTMQQSNHHPFEFQCLFGMGHALFDQIVATQACRIYAPVGTHKDLLGYLVRRLLENGSNTSFINRLADVDISIEKIIQDPVARIQALTTKPHPRIPPISQIYGAWRNSEGYDLSNRLVFAQLQTALHSFKLPPKATPTENLSHVIEQAVHAQTSWAQTPLETRAHLLEKAADLFQNQMPHFIALLMTEGGKCIPDAMSEVRETIDYCRYYAYRARVDLKPVELPSPTGEIDLLTLHPRGTFACISPWNFPLAIFTGQIVAALVTGNTVLAKPAEQTPIIATEAIRLLHQAGIPTDALQCLIGPGSLIGPQITNDPRIDGVIFTGSTATAKSIEQSLANRPGPIAIFIAETGGQNAMIVDSSALPEQTVMDIVQSAFNSAGQRCSALRVLFLQEEIAHTVLTMLQGYMAELNLNDPHFLATDIGPVIDEKARATLEKHKQKMLQTAKLIAEVPRPPSLGSRYFAPCVFELPDLSLLEGEVFGPILHVVRYQSTDLETVLEAIIKTGYGLTLGVQSRIESTIQQIIKRMPVGNAYINRNMIGAVVGVQPFGGERLSGTGPKAGGPHYLPRLCVERTTAINTTAVGGNARLVSLLEDDECPQHLP